MEVFSSTFNFIFSVGRKVTSECLPPDKGYCQISTGAMEVFVTPTLKRPCSLSPRINASFAIMYVVEFSVRKGKQEVIEMTSARMRYNNLFIVVNLCCVDQSLRDISAMRTNPRSGPIPLGCIRVADVSTKWTFPFGIKIINEPLLPTSQCRTSTFA